MGKLTSAERLDVQVTPLYIDEFETVQIEYWPANTEVTFTAKGGTEILVLEGTFEEGGDTLKELSWLRLPSGYKVHAKTGSEPVKVWRKLGHLNNVSVPPL